MKLLNTFANGAKDYLLPSGNTLRRYTDKSEIEYNKMGDIVRESWRR